MPKDVLFPEVEPSYVFERDCLAFPARVDGKPVVCLVTMEFLWAHFGLRDPSEQAMRQAYQEHRDEIHNIARSHIENGWIDEEGRVILTTRYTRLGVIFAGDLAKWSSGRSFADSAHRLLLAMIGPRAGEVTVEWGHAETLPGHSFVTLRIIDPSLPAAGAVFDLKDWEDNASLRVRLAQVWGALLQLRSRDLVVKSG